MTYPAIGTTLEPKRGKGHLPTLLVRQIHRPDRAVTCLTVHPESCHRITRKLPEIKRDYRMPGQVVS